MLMRSLCLGFLLLMAGALGTESLPSAQYMGSQAKLYNASKRGQSLAAGVLSDGKTPALSATWDASKARNMEIFLATPITLPELVKAQIIMPIATTSAEHITRISIRLKDKNGEIFQFPFSARLQALDQEQKVKFVIVPQNARHHWGGDNNGVPDMPLRINGLTVDFAPSAGRGKILLGEMSVATRNDDSRVMVRDAAGKSLPLAEAVAFALKTPLPMGIVKPGTEKELRYVFRNTAAENVKVDVEITWSDFLGEPRTENLFLELTPGETVEKSPVCLPWRNGYFQAKCRFMAPGGVLDEAERRDSCAVMVPAGPTPGKSRGFIFGICSHPNWVNDDEIYAREALATALCGAKVLRCDFSMWNIEPREGKRSFDRMDRIVGAFAKQHVELAPIMHQFPKWARAKGKLPRMDVWKQYTAGLLARYYDKVRYIEVWNEPDLKSFADFSPEEYVELLRVVKEEAAHYTPRPLVLTAGFATAQGISNDYQRRVLEKGKGFFDVHAIHQHGAFPSFRLRMDNDFLPLRRATGTTVPWYANETAVSSCGGREYMQALTLCKKLVFAWARGAIGYNWYNLRNKGDDPSDGEHNYGLLTRDFRPKPAYVVYNTLTTLLRGKQFRRALAADADTWGFAFSDGKETVVPLWRESNNRGCWLLRVPVDKVEIIDLQGNAAPARRIGEIVMVDIASRPVFLRCAGEPELQPVGDILHLDDLKPFVPGRTQNVRVRFSNPFAEAREFAWRIAMPDGINATPANGAISIPAGGMATADIMLAAEDAPEKFRTAKYEQLTLALEIPGSGYRGNFASDLAFAAVIGGRPPKTTPVFELKNREQVVSLFPADPANEHRLWRTPKDLSAKVYLWRENGDLCMLVEAVDDKHAQSYRDGDIYKGDSVQVGAALPGVGGYWELGFARDDNGENRVWVWSAPAGRKTEELLPLIKLTTAREGTLTTYETRLPLAALGATDEELAEQGLRFNLLVNDNDGEGRDGWMEAFSGLGNEKNPAGYPVIVFPRRPDGN